MVIAASAREGHLVGVAVASARRSRVLRVKVWRWLLSATLTEFKRMALHRRKNLIVD